MDGLMKSRNSSARFRGQGQGRGRGRGRGWDQGRAGIFGGRGAGILRQGLLRVNSCPSSYKIAKSFNRAKGLIWRHDLFEDSMVAAGLGVETGTKLYISNLDFGVSNEDIKELFSEIGDLRRCTVHYASNGRPSGSAEVVYARRSDAIAAVKRYNNVQLDGKPMKIEIIGNNLGLPVTPRVNVVGGAAGRGKRTVVMTPEFGQGAPSSSFNQVAGLKRDGFQRGRGQGRGRGLFGPRRVVLGSRSGSRGGVRGRRRKLPVEKSSEQLDKELEKYHAEAMNTS